MASDFDRTKPSQHPKANAQRSSSEFQEAPGEAEEVSAPNASLLAVVDTPARARLVTQLQQTQGNAYVQRVVAAQARSLAVQRDDPPQTPDRQPPVDPDRQRQQQQQGLQTPTADRLTDAAKNLALHYAGQYTRGLQDEALRQLARAWREAPGGVIAAAAIIGAEGVAYLVGTQGSLPDIPVPLDFLAGRVPAFRGATVTLHLGGPVTNPNAASATITFREQPPAGQATTPRRPGGGRAFTPRLTLQQSGVTASGREPGAEVIIEGRVPIPQNAAAQDVAATIDAIEGGRVDVDLGGSPCGLITVLSATDSYRPDRFGLNTPPLNRAVIVRLRTSIPPMFHQGPDEYAAVPVSVHINNTLNEGSATVQAHLSPFPNQAATTPTSAPTAGAPEP